MLKSTAVKLLALAVVGFSFFAPAVAASSCCPGDCCTEGASCCN